MRDWITFLLMGGAAIALFAFSINTLGWDEFLHFLPYAAGFIIIFVLSVIASANRPKPGR